MRQKFTRNRALVLLRKKDPKKWSFRRLARRYKIGIQAVVDVWQRDKNKYHLPGKKR